MGICGAVRYLGLMMLLAIFVASGVEKLMAPEVGADLLAKSNFPHFLRLAGLHLSAAEYRHVIQLTGAIFLSFSAFILLGVGRSFFAFLLAAGTAFITVCFFVDLADPLATSVENQILIMKNTSIIGGLLFVAGSGHRIRKNAGESRTQTAEQEHKKKKNQ